MATVRVVRGGVKSGPAQLERGGAAIFLATLNPDQAARVIPSMPRLVGFSLNRADSQACTPSRLSMAALNSLRCFTPLNCCFSSFWKNSCTVGVPVTPACWAIA